MKKLFILFPIFLFSITSCLLSADFQERTYQENELHLQGEKFYISQDAILFSEGLILVTVDQNIFSVTSIHKDSGGIFVRPHDFERVRCPQCKLWYDPHMQSSVCPHR